MDENRIKMRLSGGYQRNNFLWLCVIIISVLVIFDSLSFATGQVLKRLDDIAGWAVREEKIFELSKSKVKRLKQELNELEKFVSDYEETTSRHISGVTDPEQQEILKSSEEARALLVASNPMLTYRMTHRLSTMINRMQRVMLRTDPEGLELKELLGAFTDVQQHPNVTLEPIGEMFGQYYDWLPIEDDLEGALDAMIVLYDTYNPDVLEAKDFSAMISTDTSKPVKINAYHATKFSLKAFYLGYYGNALDWANYAMDKLEKERDYSISKELVHYMREFMGKSHNEEISKPPSFFPEMISYLNFFTEMVNETQTWEKRRTKLWNMSPFELELEDFPEDDLDDQLTQSFYYAACSKARLQELKNSTKKFIASPQEEEFIGKKKIFSCSLNWKWNYYFTLAPLKIEVLSESPRILEFHDILSKVEIESLVEEIREHQFKSPYPLKEFPDEYGTRKPILRTTMDAAIDKQMVYSGGVTGILRELAMKAEYLTGFQILEKGEGIKIGGVVEYPGEKYSDLGFMVSELVGGGYEAFKKRNGGDEEENRFAGSIQFYVNTAQEGGETVISGANTVVKPVKGSAILWENIHKKYNLEPMDILVGSCPVISGQQIVFKKDFMYSLDKFAYF